MKAISLFLFFVGISAQAQTPALTRFTYALDNLQKNYMGKTIDDTLANSGLLVIPGMSETPRMLLFRLESLFRLYQTSNPDLSDHFLKQVKNLEDAIGHYGDTQDFLQEAQQNQAGNAVYLAKMNADNVDALANVKKLLKDWVAPTNSPEADKIRAGVTPVFSAMTPDQDRASLVKQLLALIDTLETKNFDMTKLESGIHELRRQARWMEYYTYAIGGAIAWDSDGSHVACPADAKTAGYDSASMDAYMTATPVAPVSHPCYIAACLGAEVSTIQNTLAGIKETAVLGDAGQAQDLEYASPDVVTQATALYNQLLGKNGSPQILEEIRTELQGCLAAPAVTGTQN